MMPRPRMFDRDVAKQLRANGATYQAIGIELGVSGNSIMLGLDEAKRDVQREWQRSNQPHAAPCPTCDGISKKGRYRPGSKCISCHHEETNNLHVRESTLLCHGCETWKTDQEFSPTTNQPTRRMRHRRCKPCENLRRREFRTIKSVAQAAS